MRKFLPVSLALALVLMTVFGVLLLARGPAEANGGPDFKVTICHYDRNDSGPNAGPHTIEVAPSAVIGHLFNHTKNKGYVGDDSLGACPEPTATPTPEPTATDTPEPTATDTPEPTATNTAEPTSTPTCEEVQNDREGCETATSTPTPPSVCAGNCRPSIPSPTSTSVPPIEVPTVTPAGDIDVPATVTPVPFVPQLPDTGSGGLLQDADSSDYAGVALVLALALGFLGLALLAFYRMTRE